MAVVEVLRRRPFLIVAAPAAAGIALSEILDLPLYVLPALALPPLLTWKLKGTASRLFAIAAMGFAIGIARGEIHQSRPPMDVRRLDALLEVRVVGRVLEAPRRFGDGAGSFPLELESLVVGEGTAPWTGRVRVQFYRGAEKVSGGERVAIQGRLRPLATPGNPGVADRAASLDRQGIGAVLSTSRPVEVLERASPWRFATIADRARAGLRNLLARHAPADVAALQAALLLGSREELPADFTLALQRTGTAHFLAVSGFNLVLVLSIAWFLLLVAGVRGRAMPLTLLGLLLVYTALTGWQVSVVRAFLMSAAILAAKLFWRRSDVVNSLCIAALAILMIDPTQLMDTGFQLSFAAVLGIVEVGPVFHEFLAPPSERASRGVAPWIGRQARGALSVSLGAWLATAPIVLATFNLVTPVTLMANLLLCPLVTIQSFLAVAALPLAVLFPPGAAVAGTASTGVFQATAGIADFLTRIPGAYLHFPALPLLLVVAYYAGLALWTWRARVRPDRWKPWLVGGFALFPALSLFATPAPEAPVFGMIDVGRGSCAYVRTAEGTIVFDCGSLSVREPGAAIAAPVLWSRGITRAHTLVLSHGDADHVNGAMGLVERLGVRRLVIPPGFENDIAGLEVIVASRGITLGNLEFLGPPMDLDRSWPANDRSLVVRVTTPAGRILIPGDIEELGTRALIDSGAALDADVLVLPHHGKRQAFHRELLESVRPKLALVSAPTGYASPEVLDHAGASAVVYQTGRDGWIEVELGADGPLVRRFRGN